MRQGRIRELEWVEGAAVPSFLLPRKNLPCYISIRRDSRVNQRCHQRKMGPAQRWASPIIINELTLRAANLFICKLRLYGATDNQDSLENS